MDYQAQQGAGRLGANGPLPDDSGGPPEDQLASAAPPPPPPRRGNRPSAPPGVLGQIPADTPLPASNRGAPPPRAGGDPKTEFDAAMNLLSSGRYAPAEQSFRAFVDAHPNDERASAALYWAGDIAYSTKKDYEEAARDFAELLKKYPMAQRAPEGMLKLGLALFELNQTKEACAALAALPAKYPNASPAIAARARNERRDNNCR
jgi:tol-pal system protein YbgF